MGQATPTSDPIVPAMTHRPTANAACALLFVFLVGSGARAQNESPPNGWSSFTRLLEAYADSDRVVGTSALVIRDGRIVARHSYGFADKAAGKRVDDRSIFHWGSIT